MKVSKREIKRNKRANDVCRELRYVFSHHDKGWGNLFPLFLKWMRVAKKDKYTRPKLKIPRNTIPLTD